MPRKDSTCVTAPQVEDAKYDIVGDVHGCMDELQIAMTQAGYNIEEFCEQSADPICASHPDGRMLIFAGDLTDRGPKSDQVLRLVIGMTQAGNALSVMGNHDWKLLRYLRGNNVVIANGLASTIEQLAPQGESLREASLRLLEATPHQVRLPLPNDHPRAADGYMTVVHGAAPVHHQDEVTSNSFSRAIFGYPTGDATADGRLVRADWAAEYTGSRTVVHGHTPMAIAREKNGVICIDTGCVFGGHLTLYQVDKDDMIVVPAAANYSGKNKNLP